MDQLTLKYLRIIVPGFALLFGIYPIYNEYFIHSKSLTVTDYGYLTLIAITLGAIYHITNLQKINSYAIKLFHNEEYQRETNINVSPEINEIARNKNFRKKEIYACILQFNR
jgi:hypothetical protein